MNNSASPSTDLEMMIDPQQMAACDLLMGRVEMSSSEAIAYVGEIGVGGAITLKVLLQNAKDPVKQLADFKKSRQALMR